MKAANKTKNIFIRRLFLAITDVLSVIAASLLALLLRFNLTIDSIEGEYLEVMWDYLPISIIITLILFYIFRLYSSIWIFASVNELENIVISCVLSAFSNFIGILILSWSLPRSFYFLYMFCLIALVTATRFGYRALRLQRKKNISKKLGNNVMIIGAGEAGNMIMREMISNELLHKTIRCIIDDSKNKIGSYMHGIKVVGNRDTIPENIARYNINEIILAIPSASKKDISDIINICNGHGCAIKTLPGICELVNGTASLNQLRDIEMEDLLGRDPISVDLNSILSYVMGKTVLVTGGGGSIGSELCRQLAEHGVKRLIIVEIYENNAYAIQQELKRHYPELELIVLIASVRNTLRMQKIFNEYRPDIVYHAAAHKHVPLMEESPNEAVKNNVFGTLKTVRAASASGVSKFVLISTDKAVNPTNIMGATKRICEMIIQTYNHLSNTEFVAVRFGNVLGSNGSVIPLFKKQIAEGGPVTVTHPEIIRYFMTISEAVSLVLQAGAFAKGGEIFVLDMGEPVKILDLAENLIRLSGYIPYQDIEINFTGLRPGEKLFEELLMDEEGLKETANKLIHIGRPISFDEKNFLRQLDTLYENILTEPDNIRKLIQEIVPTYTPKNTAD